MSDLGLSVRNVSVTAVTTFNSYTRRPVICKQLVARLMHINYLGSSVRNMSVTAVTTFNSYTRRPVICKQLVARLMHISDLRSSVRNVCNCSNKIQFLHQVTSHLSATGRLIDAYLWSQVICQICICSCSNNI